MDKESSPQWQRRRKQRGTNIETIGSRVQENSRAAVLILDAVQFGGWILLMPSCPYCMWTWVKPLFAFIKFLWVSVLVIKWTLMEIEKWHDRRLPERLIVSVSLCSLQNLSLNSAWSLESFESGLTVLVLLEFYCQTCLSLGCILRAPNRFW